MSVSNLVYLQFKNFLDKTKEDILSSESSLTCGENISIYKKINNFINTNFSTYKEILDASRKLSYTEINSLVEQAVDLSYTPFFQTEKEKFYRFISESFVDLLVMEKAMQVDVFPNDGSMVNAIASIFFLNEMNSKIIDAELKKQLKTNLMYEAKDLSYEANKHETYEKENFYIKQIGNPLSNYRGLLALSTLATLANEGSNWHYRYSYFIKGAAFTHQSHNRYFGIYTILLENFFYEHQNISRQNEIFNKELVIFMQTRSHYQSGSWFNALHTYIENFQFGKMNVSDVYSSYHSFFTESYQKAIQTMDKSSFEKKLLEAKPNNYKYISSGLRAFYYFKEGNNYAFAISTFPLIERALKDLLEQNMYDDTGKERLVSALENDKTMKVALEPLHWFDNKLVSWIQFLFTQKKITGEGLNLRNQLLHGNTLSVDAEEALLILMVWMWILENVNPKYLTPGC